MLASSGTFDAMVSSVAQQAEWHVNITLPGATYSDFTLAVESCRVEATATTDVPDQVRMVAGFPTMSAAFTLSGYVDQTDLSKTAAWLFNPYNTGSPLYGLDIGNSPVTIDVGLVTTAGTELVRKFTGFLDSWDLNDDGSVLFDCVDNSTRLRSLPAMPAVATVSPYNAGLTSEYAEDALLRAASGGAITSWPKQRPQCVLAVGLRTSIWPDVGALYTPPGFHQPAPSFKAGAFGSAVVLPDETRVVNPTELPQHAWTLASTVGDDLFFEGWLTGVTTTANNGPALSVQVYDVTSGDTANLQVYPTKITVTCWAQGASATHTWTTTVDSTSHYVALKLNYPRFNNSFTGTIYLDGTSHAITTTGLSGVRSARFGTLTASKINGGGSARLEALQLTTETAPTLSYPFTPTIDLDTSLNTLTVVPGLDRGADPVQVLQDIQSAELAVGMFWEDGVYRTLNRYTAASAATVRTVTSAASFIGATFAGSAASVINRGKVGFTGWSTGGAATVWQPKAVWKVPAKSTVTRDVWLGQTVVNVPSAVSQLPTSTAITVGQNYYAASLDRSGKNPHPGLTVTAAQVSSNRVVLTLKNATTQDAYLVVPSSVTTTGYNAGDPGLWIGGQVVTPDDEVFADVQYPAAASGGAASSRYGEVLWELSGNQWVQDSDAAQQLASDIVSSSYVPRPTLTNVTIVPDPRIQVADLLHIQDPDRTSIDDYVRVFGWTLEFSGGGWDMTVDARAVATPKAWVGGVAGRSEGGVTTYGY